MVTVENPQPVVHEQFTGGSITVPSGEVWEVLIWGNEGGSGGRISINDANVAQIAGSGGEGTGYRAVVIDGDTIAAPSGVTGFVMGRKVGGLIDNTPISVPILGSSSTSVPSGETWQARVTVAKNGSNGKLTLNGDPMLYTNSGAKPVTLPLTGGDTLATDSNVNAYISGFIL